MMKNWIEKPTDYWLLNEPTFYEFESVVPWETGIEQTEHARIAQLAADWMKSHRRMRLHVAGLGVKHTQFWEKYEEVPAELQHMVTEETIDGQHGYVSTHVRTVLRVYSAGIN